MMIAHATYQRYTYLEDAFLSITSRMEHAVTNSIFQRALRPLHLSDFPDREVEWSGDDLYPTAYLGAYRLER